MQYNVAMTIGHNVKDTPTHDTQSVCEYVSQYLGIDAYTAIPCYGMWRGDAEKSTRIEICGLDRDAAEAIRADIPALAQALAQESIMFAIGSAEIAFVQALRIEAQQTA